MWPMGLLLFDSGFQRVIDRFIGIEQSAYINGRFIWKYFEKKPVNSIEWNILYKTLKHMSLEINLSIGLIGLIYHVQIRS